ncbi:MAG: hypothetical protein AAFV07_00015 [Bacteroidota bacterium]
MKDITFTECGESKGQIELAATGGQAPYQFQVGTSAFSDHQVWTDLPAAAYSVRLQDSQGCETETLVDLQTNTDFNAISPIIQTTCALSTCHDGSGEAANFTQSSVVVAHAKGIEARTRAGNMPPDTANVSLTAAEIELLGCWLANGAPAP